MESEMWHKTQTSLCGWMETSVYLPVSYTATLTTDTPLTSLAHAPSIIECACACVCVCVHACVCEGWGHFNTHTTFTFDHAAKHDILNIS